jgi:hypothetical protein
MTKQQNEVGLARSSSSELVEKFAEMQNKNEIAEVLKELFDQKKIYLIGDLTHNEVKLATRIYMVAKMKNIPIYQQGLAFYCKILLSKNRKSRKEILEAIRGFPTSQGMLSKLNPMNWGRH